MKVAIYPGTFDPITNGHLDIITRSIKFVDKLIIAVSKNNKKKTLFSFSERVQMIKKINFNIRKILILNNFFDHLNSFTKTKQGFFLLFFDTAIINLSTNLIDLVIISK
jgi:pantetheine-phosphate adenylyltransferase